MAFAIGNRLLVRPPVFHFPEDGTWFPVLIPLLLDSLDPKVRNVHGHAIVEAVTAVFKPGGKSRHTTHFLGNREGPRIHLVYQLVGQSQITDGVVILMPVEIVAIVAESLTQSVAIVEHGGHSVKAEAVEMILFQPVLAIRQQEMYHFIFSIIKAKAVPRRMFVAVAGVEILVGVARQVAQSLHLVLHGVRMYDVHDDGYAGGVGRVDQGFQFLGRAEAAGRSEERTDMIAERAIVWVLLDGHHLNAVVAFLDNAGQHVFTELIVGAHFLGVLSHAYMAFVNQQRVALGREFLFLPFVWHRIPHLS